MWDRHPPCPLSEKMDNLTKSQKKYFEEFEKYKHINVSIGIYQMKNNSNIRVEIQTINEEIETAIVKTLKSGYSKERTFHWCRKNLERI